MVSNLKGNFSGEALIYRRDEWGFPQYCVKLSNLNQQTGNYEYCYLQVSFPKNANIYNKTQIQINKSFLSFYKTRNGDDKLKLIITDFEVINETIGDIEVPENTNTIEDEYDGFISPF